ncbi:MAG: substrate-binding domain-containing protein [Bryobacteraceae bacterium]
MIRFPFFLAAIAFLVLSSACGKKLTEKKYLVAFSQCNDAEPYRAAQNASLRKLFGQDQDVELVIADAQQDNSRQIAQVEAFIRQRPDLLIVAPNERAPMTGVMGQAYAEHIPVICLERDILQPSYTSYIKSDNRKIGELAGQFIVEALTRKYKEPRGKIVELRGLLGIQAEVERYEGAHSVFRKYAGIRVVHEAVADWIQSKAKDRMTEALRAQPEIDVVYGHNDPMAIGAYLAAKELGREKEMIFVGIDGLRGPGGGISKVRDGILSATFIYPLCTDKAFEIGSRILHEPGFHPQKVYTVESTIVTPANAQQFLK